MRLAQISLAVALAVLGFAWPAGAEMAELTLQSQLGDPIGQGGNFDIVYTPQNSTFFFAQVRQTTLGLPSELLFVMGGATSGSDNPFSTLFFGTNQLGIPLQPGFYPNAQRADFASPGHPGLDVSFQNRGCNTLTGSFTIDNVTFSDPSTVDTFDSSFTQFCDGSAAALTGTFAYTATGTLTPVPEPGTWSLMATGMILLLQAVRRRRCAVS